MLNDSRGIKVRESRFLRRLRTELAVWVERGWVAPGSGEQILNYVATQRPIGVRYLPLAFSLLGVLLLGSGVITYFAANWAMMPKIVKLTILFGGMWLAYGLGGYLLASKHSPQLGQGMVLLGVILFGSNIMLIAQIYHIDAHYPNGVLLWALGGLLVGYLVGSQPAMLAAIALATLWTGMETLGFERHFHWPFLLVWASCLPAIYRARWRPGLQVALLALLLWSWLSFLAWLIPDWSARAPLYLTQIYFLAYLAMFLLGVVGATYREMAPFASPVQRYAALAALLSFYALTFPELNRGVSQWQGNAGPRAADFGVWIAPTMVALAAVTTLALWHMARTRAVHRPAYLKWGQALLALVIVLLLINLFVTGQHGGMIAVFFNLLFFAGVVWLIYAGVHNEDRFLVNTAFAFFGLGLLSRYFDTFWTLLDRSYFFMVGGLLLIGGGYFLERQRRRLTGHIVARRTEGGRP